MKRTLLTIALALTGAVAAATLDLPLNGIGFESCSSGRNADGVLSDVVPAQAGSVYWKLPPSSLEAYDRAEFTLSGLDKRFDAASFVLAFRADGNYHYAGYAGQPVIADGKAKLVFDIGKTYRKNVIVVRLFFNRANAISGPCGFRVERAQLTSAAAGGAAAAVTMTLEPASLHLESCSAGKIAGSAVRGAVPAPAGSVYWKMPPCSMEAYDRVVIRLSGLDKRFSAASFVLAFRADGKYHYAGYAERPVFADGRTVLVFDIGKAYRRNVLAVRLFFNRDKAIDGPCDFNIEQAYLEGGRSK